MKKVYKITIILGAILFILLIQACNKERRSVDLQQESLVGLTLNSMFHPSKESKLYKTIDDLTYYKINTNHLIVAIDSEHNIQKVEARTDSIAVSTNKNVKMEDDLKTVISNYGSPSYKRNDEQGAKVVGYEDASNGIILEFWLVDEKVNRIILENKK